MHDDISEAVLSREEVLKYPREQVSAYLEELRTTQRHKFYRALQHPLYPILRKIERRHENLHYVTGAVGSHRIVYASNHKSHTDYLAEPLVLDDNGIRPPLIAAGINLYGGPLGLLNRYVTGAIPIRRNSRDPMYLTTLKAYVAEIVKKHDLFFYPECGRSYSGKLLSIEGVDPTSRREVLDLAHTIMTAVGRLHKVLPTAVVANAMRPSVTRRDLEARADAVIDTLRSAGANLGVQSGAEAVAQA